MDISFRLLEKDNEIIILVPHGTIVKVKAVPQHELNSVTTVGHHISFEMPEDKPKPLFDHYDGDNFHGARWMRREKGLCDHVEAEGTHAWVTKGDDTYCSFCKLRRY